MPEDEETAEELGLGEAVDLDIEVTATPITSTSTSIKLSGTTADDLKALLGYKQPWWSKSDL